jgi:hypothetical protein
VRRGSVRAGRSLLSATLTNSSNRISGSPFAGVASEMNRARYKTTDCNPLIETSTKNQDSKWNAVHESSAEFGQERDKPKDSAYCYSAGCQKDSSALSMTAFDEPAIVQQSEISPRTIARFSRTRPNEKRKNQRRSTCLPQDVRVVS